MSLDSQLLDHLQLVGAVAVGAATLLRIPLIRSAESRPFWYALLSLTLGQTLQIEGPYQAVDHLLRTPGTAAVLKHACALFSAANARAVVLTMLPASSIRLRNRRSPWPVLAVALTVSAAPWLISPPNVLSPALAHRAEYFDPGWRSVIHWAAFLGYLSWTLWGSIVLTRLYRRSSPPSGTRTGSSLVGLGMAIGFSYIAEKSITVIAWASNWGPQFVRFDQTSEAITLSVTVTLIAVGACWEHASRTVVYSLLRHHRDIMNRKALTQFAEEIRTSFPELRTPDALPVGEQVVAALAVIHEGLRRLTAYAEYTEPSTTSDQQALLTAQSTWLRHALMAKDKGGKPKWTVSASPVADSGGTDNTIRYLIQLHRESKTAPVKVSTNKDLSYTSDHHE